MRETEAASTISIEVSIDGGRAVIRCGRCRAEQVLWTRGDLELDGLAALFTQEHLDCALTPGTD